MKGEIISQENVFFAGPTGQDTLHSVIKNVGTVYRIRSTQDKDS
jgi:hypothetical protein